MTNRFVGFLLIAVLGSCSLISASASDPEIRVENRSNQDFTRVFVRFQSEDVDYGALGAGNASEYESVEEAYRYAYIEVDVGGRTLVLQPIDFVGESLLGAGRYTYVLDVGPGGESLALVLERD